jgi:hypothetical protein
MTNIEERCIACEQDHMLCIKSSLRKIGMQEYGKLWIDISERSNLCFIVYVYTYLLQHKTQLKEAIYVLILKQMLENIGLSKAE